MVYLKGSHHTLTGTSDWKPVNLPGREIHSHVAHAPRVSRNALTQTRLAFDQKSIRNSLLHQAFLATDKDGNGQLSRLELSVLLRRVVPDLSRKEIDKQMRIIDTNKDDLISFEEFLAWLEHDNQKQLAESLMQETSTGTPNALMTVFRLLDADESGSISEAEMRKFMGHTCPKFASDVVWKQLMEAMDTNKDGMINYSEFVEFLFPSSARGLQI
jgi:Ca2+-binding EF-hand superfamily protein